MREEPTRRTIALICNSGSTITLTGRRETPQRISKEEKKEFLVVSGAKAEDTNNIKNEGTVPEKENLLNELEIIAREDLIKMLREQVTELPNKLYETASKREQDGDNDDAGEAYMRFLGVAPVDQLDEREHAEKFLRDQFNFQRFPQRCACIAAFYACT